MTRWFMNCFHVQSLATTLTWGKGGPFTSEYRGFDQSSNNFWPRLSECSDIDAMLGIAPLT